MSEKKQVPTSLVIMTIIILFLLMIVPPAFRGLYPKDEDTGSDSKEPETKEEVLENNNNSVILNCIKENENIGISIRANATYKNDELISNEITYNFDGKVDQNSVTGEDKKDMDNYLSEILLYSSIEGGNISKEDNNLVINIDKSLANKYSSLKIIDDQWQSFDTLMDYYQNKDFICTQASSGSVSVD